MEGDAEGLGLPDRWPSSADEDEVWKLRSCTREVDATALAELAVKRLAMVAIGSDDDDAITLIAAVTGGMV